MPSESLLGRVVNRFGPVQDPSGVDTGPDTDLDVDDNADGSPVVGEVGRGQATFAPDDRYSTYRPGDVDWLRYGQVERPIVVRAEQPDWWSAKAVPVTSSAVELVAANPHRIRCEIYVKSDDDVLLGPDEYSATSTAIAFPAEQGYPFLSDVVGAIWGSSPGADQSVYVIEYFRSGQAQGHPVEFGGR
jgi:hypothetical protein